MADIDKLFEQISNEVLTEEVKLQMSVLFENSLNEAIKAKEAELEAQNKTEIDSFKEGLVTQIDDYLTYFVEEFTKKNTQVIEEQVKIKTAEKVLKTFQALVNDFHVQLDEKKEVETDKLEESKKEISRLTNELIKSKKEVKLREKAAIVLEATSGLETDMEKAKLVEFAKNLPFDELFEKKVTAFRKATLSEAKVVKEEKEVPKKEKLVIQEEKIVEPAPEKTAVDTYLDRL